MISIQELKASAERDKERFHHEVVLALITEIELLRKDLEFYADGKQWTSMTDGWRQLVCIDKSDCEYRPNNELMIQYGGVTARQALASSRERVG
ncbi:hypothetical protein [Caudoviricetes sp.]|nr:hypothetical protein [Caudoviricetes sp.]UOF79129.1 hypothetical protein [Caudoviricetes sp.]